MHAGDAVQIRTPTTPHTGDALVTALAGCRDTGVMRMRTPITAAKAQGVVVCGTDSHPEPAVELTWVLILAVMRHLVPEANALREQGPWRQSVGRDLHGARLGLPELGGIRQRVARISPAGGLQVCAWRLNLDAGQAEAAGVHLAVSRQALFASRTYWRRRLGAMSPRATTAMPSARRSNASPPDCRTRRGACWTDADQATAAAR